MENRFNLIDEAWIPIADVGRVSIRDVFSHSEYRALSGNPVQKIAVLKLLLAIAQAASTPQGEAEWRQLGWQGLAQQCLEYLGRWYERFYLYGEKPFLQMPEIVSAAKQTFGAVLPEISTGNTTVLIQSQVEHELPDADRALLIVSLMAFALGGKKTDNRVVLDKEYRGKSNDKGKPSTGKPGPAVAHMGLLHSFCIAESITQTLWLNLLTQNDIDDSGYYPEGVGIPPWEAMPLTENCNTATRLKQSLIGRLVPVCRFCLLAEEGLHYSEGLAHASYLDSVVDPSVAVNFSQAKPKVLWANPERRPWRELTALLSFFQQHSTGFDCLQLKAAMSRVRHSVAFFAVWSGGLRVTSNAGEQFVSGSDDAVESIIWLESAVIGESWFQQLEAEMEVIERMAKTLYGCTSAFYKQQLMDGSHHAAQATGLFWQLCERDVQRLVESCYVHDDQANDKRFTLRRRFAEYVQRSYNQYCPQKTARQLDAWAKCRPNLAKYLKQPEVV